MLTIGPPGFLAFLAYLFIAGLFIRSLTYWLEDRKPGSTLAKALAFIY